MEDRFRELERPLAMRKKDVVLLATVTSFEALPNPGKSEQKQFSELFRPLYAASSGEARRQAVAALSRCRAVPDEVALFLGRQPIDIAALFLSSTAPVSDTVLVAVARESEAHARAIARRESLSPAVVDALVGLRHERLQKRPQESHSGAAIRPQPDFMVKPSQPQMTKEDMKAMHEEDLIEKVEAPSAAEPQAPWETAAGTAKALSDGERQEREERLRQNIKDLARHLNPPESDRAGLRRIQPVEMALFARFARAGEIGLFTTALSYALSSTRWLAERILLDMSGQQLATVLVSLGMPDQEAVEVLTGIYPHLAAPEGHGTRADLLMESLDQRDCDLRVDSWLRADTYSFPSANAEDRHAKTRRFRR